MIVWLWMFGCAQAPKIPSLVGGQDVPPASVAPDAPIPSGWFDAGRYVDAQYRFSVDIPTGWRVEIGERGGELRVRLRHPPTGTSVVVRAGNSRPAPFFLPGCLWTFDASGPFRGLSGGGTSRVATCMPDNPMNPRVFATIAERDGLTWQLEVHVPGDQLLKGMALGQEVLATIRWG